MEEENNGITFRGICKTIWLRKWVALIVAVAVALIMSVSLYYGYNPTVKTYEVAFNLNLPGNENGSFYSYPDGEVFHYADLTSAKTLGKIKEQGDFAGINVEKMTEKRHISIKRDITTTLSATGTVNAITEVTYTISAKASYFESRNQARDFLTRVANYPTDYLENMDIDYDVYLSFAKIAIENDSNEVAVKYLNDQIAFLLGEYDNLKKTYGDTFVVANGKTLLACEQELEAYKVNTADTEASLKTVESFTASFRTTSKAVYAKATSVVFVQPSVIVETGGMGLTKTLLLSVIVAVIVALIAAYVAGYYKLKALKAVKSSDGNEIIKEEVSTPAEAENTAEKTEENKD